MARVVTGIVHRRRMREARSKNERRAGKKGDQRSLSCFRCQRDGRV